MKIKTKIALILSGIGAALLFVLTLFRETGRGRVSAAQIKDLKKGLKDARKENDQEIKKALDEVKLQNKLIKEREAEVRNMNMSDQQKLAKKMGLI